MPKENMPVMPYQNKRDMTKLILKHTKQIAIPLSVAIFILMLYFTVKDPGMWSMWNIGIKP